SAKLQESTHLPGEIVEQVRAVVRAGRCFRVVLDAEDGVLLVAHALEGAVVEVDVRRLDVGGEGGGGGGENVVLGRDLDAAGGAVEDGLVGAAMAELEFERLRSEGQAEQLMAETDAEDRFLADELA